jgi:phenylalanyl-tRNA synthetase beta chain
MAREFSAIFKNPLKNPFDEKWQKDLESKISGGKSPVKVKFDGDSAGIGYFGLTVKNIKVGESPAWMKKRLTAVGLRPINSIVDISNYVMLELGFPNHIFDRDLIEGDEVIIKRVGENTTFTTLDEEDRSLVPEDTVICDSKKPLVIGGLMGGLNSGVNENTNTVFLEVANWKAAQVRRTSTRLGLRTDSSQRYEKSLDSHLMKRALLRILELIIELNPEAEVVGGIEYDGSKYWEDAPLVKPLTLSKINSVLGTKLKSEEVIDILESLDFHVLDEDPFIITVPTYRATKDIEHPDDIIEEIGRIIGYDNISSTAPKWEMTPARLTQAQSLHRKIRDFMVYHAKSFEVMTYPLVGEKLYKNSSWALNDDHLLLNALSVEQSRMRPSLIPSLLEAAGINAKNFSEYRFFELGRSYLKTSENFQDERSQLGMVFYDSLKTPFVELCNNVETLLQTTNIPGELVPSHPKFKNPLVSEDWEGMHPFEFLNIRVMGKMVGAVLSIHPVLLRKFKIKGHLSMAILDMTNFENNRLKDKTKYKPLPKFPGSKFDCSVVLDKDRPVGDIFLAMKKVKIKEIDSFKIVDIFSEGDKKSVTVRATFIDPEKTLSGDFLAESQKLIMDSLDKAGFPLKE